MVIYSIDMHKLVLLRKFNHRNIELHGDSRGESIGVLTKDGSYRYVPWLGFIERRHAKGIGGRPVKLEVARIGHTDGWHTSWRDVEPGRHVQGCLVARGVYAVTEQGVRLV